MPIKEVISCSRRTDIPAFYYDLLQQWLQAGSVTLHHPLYPEKVYTVNVSPDKIHSIVLWSKDYSKIARDPGLLKNYNLYFQYTITLYGKDIEPNVPDFNQTLNTLSQLIMQYRSDQFNFRFDPILFAKDIDTASISGRLKAFEYLCKTLQSMGYYNSRITTSYISLYPQVKKRLSELNLIEPSSEKNGFFKTMLDIANNYGFPLYACANSDLLNIEGIKPSHCIDGVLLGSLFGEKCTKSKDKGQRIDCGCIKSRDIGSYLPCYHDCKYCYANAQ